MFNFFKKKEPSNDALKQEKQYYTELEADYQALLARFNLAKNFLTKSQLEVVNGGN